MAVTTTDRARIVGEYQRKQGDTGSPEVQIALITGRIYPSLGLEKLPMRALTVAIIAALAALLPAYEAARHEPAQALHFV